VVLTDASIPDNHTEDCWSTIDMPGYSVVFSEDLLFVRCDDCPAPAVLFEWPFRIVVEDAEFAIADAAFWDTEEHMRKVAP
jgi:hypothetical protein